MLDSDEWKEMQETLERELQNSKYAYFSAREFALIFWRGMPPIDLYMPCTTTNAYFGESEENNSEYIVRLIRPFDAAGLIAIANKTLGGKLFAREYRYEEKNEYEFVVKFLEDFRDLYFKKKGGYFYVDYGYFQIENEIKEKYGR